MCKGLVCNIFGFKSALCRVCCLCLDPSDVQSSLTTSLRLLSLTEPHPTLPPHLSSALPPFIIIPSSFPVRPWAMSLPHKRDNPPNPPAPSPRPTPVSPGCLVRGKTSPHLPPFCQHAPRRVAPFVASAAGITSEPKHGFIFEVIIALALRCISIAALQAKPDLQEFSSSGVRRQQLPTTITGRRLQHVPL